MMTKEKKVPRRQLILEALARELEQNPGDRITTASLSKAVGVSEAALYRHFASKAKMFEGLMILPKRVSLSASIRFSKSILTHKPDVLEFSTCYWSSQNGTPA